MFLDKGETHIGGLWSAFPIHSHSILEYLTRDDADAAVKTLDGKDLRGQQVRVALSDDPVRRAPGATFVFFDSSVRCPARPA